MPPTAPAPAPKESRESSPIPGADEGSRKERILAAAIELFAEKGFAAVRIDEVALRADANKQLIYYYFGSKAELYSASLARLVELVDPVWAELEAADTLERALTRYARRTPLGAVFRRYLAWEGVEQAARGGDILLEDVRTVAWRRLIGIIEKAQEHHELPEGIDPAMFALLITSFTSTPVVLPQIAKMISGVEPDSDEFATRQQALINALLAALRPAP